ncbi:MAG: T9SS type A sorting domain-containing protein [Ignavibacteria bacterium]|nr:T9SS type A sorting domain-containing protein [Ignavibacteria bacterium]
MRPSLLAVFFILAFSAGARAQFTGHSGVYYLGAANVPVSAAQYANPSVSGVVVRFRWSDTEPAPGSYNWSFIDGEIAKAMQVDKKVSLQPLGVPDWLADLGARQYFSIDENAFHSSYGQIVSDMLPWDTVHVRRYLILLKQLAARYASNPTVAYINTVGGAFSRNLPDSVLTDTTARVKEAFWKVYAYDADTVAALMNAMTDSCMALFPSTHLWCSMDYVTFETQASGRPRNSLASRVAAHGIAKYPDRFGVWREDVAGCNPPANISSGSHWYLVAQNPCRSGAQMLWSVQDGPSRMNKCGIVPNSKAAVLDSAVNRALALGMRYLEIYGADIADTELASSIQRANMLLIARGTACAGPTQVKEIERQEARLELFPNPASGFLSIVSKDEFSDEDRLCIYSASGIALRGVAFARSARIDISDLSKGLYYLVLYGSKPLVRTFVIY